MNDFISDPYLKFYTDLREHDGNPFMSKDAYGHSCTVSGAIWTPQGRYFDGSDDGITIPDHAAFNTSPYITVIAWFNGAAQSQKGILAQQDYGNNQRSWALWSGGANTSKLRAYVSDDGTSLAGHVKDYESSITALDSTWHMGAFTFNAGTLTLYVDGVADINPTKSLDDAITIMKNSTSKVGIGCLQNNGAIALTFAGTIGEGLIYSRVFSPVEMQNIYLVTKGEYR